MTDLCITPKCFYYEFKTPEGFSAAVENGSTTFLVLFHAKWCPHCKTFKPRFKKEMTELIKEYNRHHKQKMSMGMVDIDLPGMDKLMEKYEIPGVPTLLIVTQNHQFTLVPGVPKDLKELVENVIAVNENPPKEDEE